MFGTLFFLIFIGAVLYYRNKPKRLVEIQIYYTLCVGFLIYNLNAPRAILYLCDFINMLLLLHILLRFRRTGRTVRQQEKTQCKFKRAKIIMIVFICIGIGSSIINFYGLKGVLLLLWGLRNYGRFFIFFLACTNYLRSENVPNLFRNLKWILYLSTFLAFYEYYVMGLGFIGHSGDYIGGIFGADTTGNAALCLFMSGMCTYFICMYINRRAKSIETIAVISCSLYTAALAEIKFFFFILVFLGALAIILNKPSFKTAFLTLTGSILLIFLASLMQSRYESYYISDIFSLEGISNYIFKSSYSYTSDSINRFGGISQINRLVFGETSLIGIGLGNADHSSFFSSAAYDKLSYTNYMWFLIPYLYLETGILGLVSYASIYIGLIVDAIKQRTTDIVAKRSVIILSLTALIIMIYNCSLRVDSAYIYFMFLSLAFLKSNDSEFVYSPKSRLTIKIKGRGIYI